MAKKKFTAGLEMLFGDQDFDPQNEQVEVETRIINAPLQSDSVQADRKRNGKNFISNIESVFTDTFSEQLNNAGQNDFQAPSTDGLGLDALVRSTIEDAELEVSYEKRKRVTLLIEHANLSRLKEIASEEQRYFKDLVNTIFADFISDYGK